MKMNKRVSVQVKGSKIVLKLDATAFVKWENRAAAAGVPLLKYLSLFLAGKVQRTLQG